MLHPRSEAEIRQEILIKRQIKKQFQIQLERGETGHYSALVSYQKDRLRQHILKAEEQIKQNELDAARYESKQEQNRLRHEIALLDLQQFLLDLMLNDKNLRGMNSKGRGRTGSPRWRAVDWPWLLGFAHACVAQSLVDPGDRAAVAAAEGLVERWVLSYALGGDVPSAGLHGIEGVHAGLPWP